MATTWPPWKGSRRPAPGRRQADRGHLPHRQGQGHPFAEHDPSWHHKSKLPVEVHADLYAALEDA